MSSGKRLKTFIDSYVKQNGLDENLGKEFPTKWEKYGDFVLFDERAFRWEAWKTQGTEFWQNVASILHCKRIGVKNKIKNDGFRSPNVRILLGSDPWISCKDNAILYTWNVLENMFSAGNAGERHRIAKLNCDGETVVDLFAGIGYFTLPFLLHAKAEFVHACEWNPAACEALRRNLKLNKSMPKCKIYEGDCRSVCPKKIAHRINLGLIPSSESYWKIACEALLEQGGMLHVHENVEIINGQIQCSDCKSFYSQFYLRICQRNILIIKNNNFVLEGDISIRWKHNEWLIKGLHILHCILSILTKLNSDATWRVSIENVNFVKSYAPKIHHLVYDVRVDCK